MERLTVAALIPFKRYVHLRRTGKTRVVKYDDKKIVMRSSLLPRPEKDVDVRYSRVGLRKLLRRMNTSMRELRRRVLMGLPRERPYALYRLLLRLERIRKRGLSSLIKRLKAEVLNIISYPGALFRKALKRLVRVAIERERRKGRRVKGVEVKVKDASGVMGILKRGAYALMGYKRIGRFLVKVSVRY